MAVLFCRLYSIALIVGLLWTFLRRPAVYLHVRRTFIAMTCPALLVFWAVPMSPPRFALPGSVDIIVDHDILAGQSSRDLSSGANHFSATPRLHVGWSAWCAYAVWLTLRDSHPRAALLATGIAVAPSWQRLWRTRVSSGGQGATRHPPFGAV